MTMCVLCVQWVVRLEHDHVCAVCPVGGEVGTRPCVCCVSSG